MTTAARTYNASLVSVPARIAALAVIAGVLALVYMGAQKASHQAVQTAATTFQQGPAATHFTLPSVQIVAKRGTNSPSSTNGANPAKNI